MNNNKMITKLAKFTKKITRICKIYNEINKNSHKLAPGKPYLHGLGPRMGLAMPIGRIFQSMIHITLVERSLDQVGGQWECCLA